MPKSAVVLIDGNNLYHNLRNIRLRPSGLDILKFSDFLCSHFGVERDHIIYYNSIPKMTDPSYFKHKNFLDGLERGGIEVKKRKLQYKSNREAQVNVLKLVDKMNLCGKCKPVVLNSLLNWVGKVVKKEKGIDVMMAVDTIRITLEKKYDCCIVVSGDVDLISAMKFAESKGGNILSAFIASGYSNEIKSGFKHFTMDKKTLLKNCIKDKLKA